MRKVPLAVFFGWNAPAWLWPCRSRSSVKVIFSLSLVRNVIAYVHPRSLRHRARRYSDALRVGTRIDNRAANNVEHLQVPYVNKDVHYAAKRFLSRRCEVFMV